MLQLTATAAEAIRLIVESAEVSETGGMRIFARPIDEESASIDLTVVETPEPADEVIGEGDARVFLEQGAAMLLNDKVLDANVEGDRVAFSVEDQPGEPGLSPDGLVT